VSLLATQPYSGRHFHHWLLYFLFFKLFYHGGVERVTLLLDCAELVAWALFLEGSNLGLL